ncbi:MAG: type 1 glutamine amidotransferase [Dehalococcoidales bacterium]|nr:type 1 glutamine amidotransferase [Dehalococcoidales bacterium]
MLDGKRIAILVENGFDEAEVTEPLRAMKKAGARVVILGGSSRDSYAGKKGETTMKADAAVDQVRAEDFDAIIIPGGYAPDRMRLNKAMVNLVRRAHKLGKLIAAICHGPQLLISAEIVRGRRLTSWPSISIDLVNAGADWVDEPVVIDVDDGKLITSRKPADLPRFNKAIIKALRD